MKTDLKWAKMTRLKDKDNKTAIVPGKCTRK